MMERPPSDPTVVFHVKVALGMVVSLAIARLLTGVARFVQHPARHKPDALHLTWALAMLVTLLHFWWFQYHLSDIAWRFEVFAFVMTYAVLYFVMCAVLFPDDIAEYAGYRDYLLSRRRWFFGMLAVSMAFDGIDSLLKGRAHFDALGVEYPIRLAVYAALALAAALTRNERFHLLFAVGGLAYQVSWIARRYDAI
jgi:ribose/xylose/arabinose/galactoside ABC-type transport system permease subunit